MDVAQPLRAFLPDGLTTSYVPPRAVRSVNGPTKPDRLCSRGGASFANQRYQCVVNRTIADQNNVCGLFVAAAHACIGHAEPLVRRQRFFQ